MEINSYILRKEIARYSLKLHHDLEEKESVMWNDNINPQTKMIHFSEHTGCGEAVTFSYTIFPDSLIYRYSKHRINFEIQDKVLLSKGEYDKLIDDISKVKFSYKKWTSTDKLRKKDGCAGNDYSFYLDIQEYPYHDPYISIDNQQLVSENFNKIRTLIKAFVKSHQTNAERIAKKCDGYLDSGLKNNPKGPENSSLLRKYKINNKGYSSTCFYINR